MFLTMSVPSNLFQKKTFVVVSGSSLGLGECISLTFGKKFPKGSVFILLSRDGKALEKVKARINSDCPGQICHTKEFDQGIVLPENFDSLFDSILQSSSLSLAGLEQAVMVHSAGSLGDITKYCKEICDPETIRDCFDVNVVGAILINSAFLKTFHEAAIKKIIVNVSSLAALQPFKSWSLYCSGL